MTETEKLQAAKHHLRQLLAACGDFVGKDAAITDAAQRAIETFPELARTEEWLRQHPDAYK